MGDVHIAHWLKRQGCWNLQSLLTCSRSSTARSHSSRNASVDSPVFKQNDIYCSEILIILEENFDDKYDFIL